LSSDSKGGKQTVSAFVARQRLVMGQVQVEDKANEIVAIPKLLDMLAIEGAMVTIDAMGCQRAIAQKIIDKKVDYILALKGNQGRLREDVEDVPLFRRDGCRRDGLLVRSRIYIFGPIYTHRASPCGPTSNSTTN
jgi:hypothetical protein